MEEFFEITHTFGHLAHRWRNVHGISWSRSADPILARAKLAGRFLCSSSGAQQYAVHLFQQSTGDWKTIADSSQPMLQGRNIVGNLFYIGAFFAEIIFK